jgi:hypothetical protein
MSLGHMPLPVAVAPMATPVAVLVVPVEVVLVEGLTMARPIRVVAVAVG